MCEYCEERKELELDYNNKNINEIALHKKDFILKHYIQKNEIFILANLGFRTEENKTAYISTTPKILINYCPMCGRKLGGK